MECHWTQDKADSEELVLTQTTLIENLATAHSMSGAKSSPPTDLTLFEIDKGDPCNQKEFQRIVGGLLYIARTTRPEISIQVNLLGWRTANPSNTNLRAAKQVCHYLLSTRSEGLRMKGTEGENLEAKIYADASYGGEEAKSQTGVVVTLNKQTML